MPQSRPLLGNVTRLHVCTRAMAHVLMCSCDHVIMSSRSGATECFWSFVVLISSGILTKKVKNLQILWCLTISIFLYRNSHRHSTRKRWQNRSRRNWAQMATSANSTAMQKGKNQKLFLVKSSLQRSVSLVFSHRFLLIMQKKLRRFHTTRSKTQFDFFGLNLG